MANRLRLEVIRLQGLDEILIVPQSWICGLTQQSVVRLDLRLLRPHGDGVTGRVHARGP